MKVQKGAKDHRRDRGDDQTKRQAGAGGVHPAAGQRQQSAKGVADVLPKKQHHSGQCAYMYSNVDRLTLIFHAGEVR